MDSNTSNIDENQEYPYVILKGIREDGTDKVSGIMTSLPLPKSRPIRIGVLYRWMIQSGIEEEEARRAATAIGNDPKSIDPFPSFPSRNKPGAALAEAVTAILQNPRHPLYAQAKRLDDAFAKYLDDPTTRPLQTFIDNI